MKTETALKPGDLFEVREASTGKLSSLSWYKLDQGVELLGDDLLTTWREHSEERAGGIYEPLVFIASMEYNNGPYTGNEYSGRVVAALSPEHGVVLGSSRTVLLVPVKVDEQ